MFDALLYAVVPATVTGPSVAIFFISSPGSLVEIGAVLNVSISVAASRGTINGVSPYTGNAKNAAGEAGWILSLPNAQTFTLAVTPPQAIASYANSNYTALSGSQTWQITKAEFASGLPYSDSQGGNTQNYPGSINITSNTLTVIGAYPIFTGRSSDGALTNTTLLNMATTSFAISQNWQETTAPKRHKFAISDAMLGLHGGASGTFTRVQLQIYNPLVPSNYSNFVDQTQVFDVGTTSLTVQGNSVPYTTFTATGATLRPGDGAGGTIPLYRVLLG